MPDARTRLIALCRRGFAPVGVWSLVRPRETYPPYPEAQRELEQFLERSARHFEPTDTVLEALFADAVDVGAMRAALISKNGTPEGFVRLDARELLHTFDGLEAPADMAAPADVVLEEFNVDVWERAPVSAEVRWRWQTQLLGADTPDHVLAPIVRHFQGRGIVLLRQLLGRVLAAQGVRHALGSCRFDDPSEPGPPVRATMADNSGLEPEPAIQTFPGGIRLRVPAGMTRQDLLEECVDAAGLADGSPPRSARTIADQWKKRHGRTIDDKTAGQMVRAGRAELAERTTAHEVRNDCGSAEVRK